MKVHDLKVWPASFIPLSRGEKHVELRRDDRGYAVDDVLVLREWDPDKQEPTGRWRVALVTHLVRSGDAFGQALADGWVALSVRIFRRPRTI